MPHLRSFGIGTRRCQADSQFPFNFYVVSISIFPFFLPFSLSFSFSFSLSFSLSLSLSFIHYHSLSLFFSLLCYWDSTRRCQADSQFPFNLYVVSISVFAFFLPFSLSFSFSFSLSFSLSYYIFLYFSLTLSFSAMSSSSFLWHPDLWLVDVRPIHNFLLIFMLALFAFFLPFSLFLSLLLSLSVHSQFLTNVYVVGISLFAFFLFFSLSLSVCLCLCLSASLSLWLSVCLSVCLSVFLYPSLSSVCLSMCLSLSLSLFLSWLRLHLWAFSIGTRRCQADPSASSFWQKLTPRYPINNTFNSK